MKIKNIILSIPLLALISLGACAQTPKPNIHIGDTSQNSLDWAGVYKGVLPCADCSGIKTIITLKNDNSIIYQTKYLGKDEEIYTESGKFTWSQDGSTIYFDNMRLKIGENKLIWLDGNGQIISGNLADNFILHKYENAHLTENYWKLNQINEKPIIKYEKEPYIILKSDGKLKGFSGCNQMFGSHKEDGNNISFSQISMTKMLCSDTFELETEYWGILKNATYYNISGDFLTIFNKDKKPIARFEVVYLK